MPRIALITERYPFSGADAAFLPREVGILAESIQVIVLPTSRVGAPQELPSGVELDTSLCGAPVRPKLIAMLSTLISRDFWIEARRHGVGASQPRTLARLAVRAARVRWSRRRFAAWLDSARIDLVYAWWGTPPAVGAAQALVGTDIPLVVRVHGYDLYGARDALGFVPYQRYLLERATMVYSVSTAGARYLQTIYPDLADHVGVAHLGVDAPVKAAKGSRDGVFRIVTCSRAVPIKRLDLMLNVVASLQRGGQKVEWTHLGDGPLLDGLREQASLEGVSCTFVGHIPSDEVTMWLTDHPVDLFCNVSDSEGLPVSLMEAAACGIPMLARDVGGNREIVDNSVGCLLPASSGAVAITEALRSLMSEPYEVREGKRRASRARWAEQFQARVNYVSFASDLASFAAEPGHALRAPRDGRRLSQMREQ